VSPQLDGGKYDMMWAPEPKMQALPFGATSFILAEAYYGSWLLPVLNAYGAGNMQQAEKLQLQLNALQNIVCCDSGKSVMKMLGIDLGPPRLPSVPISQDVYDKVFLNLSNFGFFNHTM